MQPSRRLSRRRLMGKKFYPWGYGVYPKGRAEGTVGTNARNTLFRMSRIVQKYYPISELAWTLSFSESSIRRWAREGLFGPETEFLEIGSDVRIPTSGVLFFIEHHQRRIDAARVEANKIRGRTLGEAKRRAQAVDSNGSPDV